MQKKITKYKNSKALIPKKFLLPLFIGLFLVIGLVVALILGSTNQDNRQQAYVATNPPDYACYQLNSNRLSCAERIVSGYSQCPAGFSRGSCPPRVACHTGVPGTMTCNNVTAYGSCPFGMPSGACPVVATAAPTAVPAQPTAAPQTRCTGYGTGGAGSCNTLLPNADCTVASINDGKCSITGTSGSTTYCSCVLKNTGLPRCAATSTSSECRNGQVIGGGCGTPGSNKYCMVPSGSTSTNCSCVSNISQISDPNPVPADIMCCLPQMGNIAGPKGVCPAGSYPGQCQNLKCCQGKSGAPCLGGTCGQCGLTNPKGYGNDGSPICS